MLKSLIACACVVLLPLVASAVTMEMVTVGDPGNAPDPANTNTFPGIGSVDYVYAIGRFEVRNSEYAEFLNSVAAIDTYGLYNTNMSTDAHGGINRSGSSGSYTYSVKSSYANFPVVYVSFYDAARFANWLENGQPTGAQGPGTTEKGSYTLFTSGSSTTNVSARGADATWVLPSENEWYKAAYYQPSGSGGPSDSYWRYPMQSDSQPYSDQPPGTSSPNASNAGNFIWIDGLANGYDDGYAKTGSPTYYSGTNYLTNVGAYTTADSYYGTFDQGGNVWEWDETNFSGSNRGLRGGDWYDSFSTLRSSYWNCDLPTNENRYVGFRIAAIPRMPALTAASVSGAAIRLELKGSVGLAHLVEVSGELTNWQPWAIVTPPAGGWSTNFPADPEIPRRFWRARHGEAPPGFVLIPAGNFQMGSSFQEGGTQERPRHTVCVSGFYMQSTEVTKAQWAEVRTWALTHGYTNLSAGAGKAPDHPVQTVTWYDVVRWCNARSEKEGLSPCYYTTPAKTTVYRTESVDIADDAVDWGANGYRLPTEAEWEKAARGGSSGHRFPWSPADWISHNWANYFASTAYSYDGSPTLRYHPAFETGPLPYTSPVGYFAANGYGLHDMAGNVWEWCWDRYSSSYYESSLSSDPLGPTSGAERVNRGGAWNSSAPFCRVACRGYDNPDNGHYLYGFRPVRR